MIDCDSSETRQGAVGEEMSSGPGSSKELDITMNTAEEQNEPGSHDTDEGVPAWIDETVDDFRRKAMLAVLNACKSELEWVKDIRGKVVNIQKCLNVLRPVARPPGQWTDLEEAAMRIEG